MTTPYVARCSVCGVAPFSENDPKGLGYTLKRFPDGELYCEAHYPPKRRAPPPTAVTPRDALDDLEKTLAAQIEALDGAIAGAVEDVVADAIEALTGKTLSALTEEQREIIEEIVDGESATDAALDKFEEEIGRGFATPRRALAAQSEKPPRAPDGAPKSHRPPEKINAKERLGDRQQDWVAGNAQSAREDSP